MSYLLIKDPNGEYFVDMENRVSVFVDDGEFGIDSIGHLMHNWEPLDVEYVDIPKEDFLKAYKHVVNKLNLNIYEND
jgi:hypothetical protein